ncbi:hypothetical protein QQS21_004282 [Conoideocrella luteorostrata]|uniref:Uncharacterized protein n=1 Tax=Conoideocrella luteorostrata TaxID=1105319 RepID=A0AAJ0CRL9_9HYPO|nr:hypothetical protein QQS21_004282 [Conoideocrella luteorostrata]
MANSAKDQALVATFAFGLVVCAALGTVLFHLKGGALSLVRGGLRLVLAGFLIFATLWAVDGFIGTFIDERSSSGCQIAVAFASAFDQLARISLEEYLFWAMKSDIKATFGFLFPQAIIFSRFILGGIFVGVQRPQFAPVCVTTNLLWPLGVGVLVTDAFIVVMLLTRASSVGVFSDMKAEGPVGFRAKGLIFTTIALGLWIPSSVPMILGIASLGIATRTALPALGVLFVIACISFFYKGLVWPQQEISQKTGPYVNNFPGLPEAAAPPARESRSQAVSAVESTYPANILSRPSQPSTSTKSGTAERTLYSRDATGVLPTISRPNPGQAAAGVGGIPVKGQLFPPIRADPLPVHKRDLQTQPTKKATIKGGKLAISYPIIQQDNLNDASPLKRIATVDLATAAKQEKDRRNNTVLLSYSAADATAKQQPLTVATYNQKRSQSTERKEVAKPGSDKQESRQTLGLTEEPSSQGASSSVLTPPLADSAAIRQRSPRHISQLLREELRPSMSTKSTSRPGGNNLSRSDSVDTIPPKVPPRSPLRPSPAAISSANVSVGQDKSSSEVLQPYSAATVKSKGFTPAASPAASLTAPAPASNQRSTQLPRRDASLSKSKSNTLSNTSLDVLVPPIPPLSPRDANLQPYYGTGGSLGAQYRNNGGIPRSGSVKESIRPSRQRPTTPPPEDATKPTKTPVQLRKASGLPQNPRAQAAMASGSNSQAQTAMFVNGSDYGDPSQPSWDDVGNRDSVVNRPRPIPRKSPVRPSIGAKELLRSSQNFTPTSSDKAPIIRSTILQATAGSPSQLPPLPPTPKSAGYPPPTVEKMIPQKQADREIPAQIDIPQRLQVSPQSQSTPSSSNQNPIANNAVQAATLPRLEARIPLYARRNEDSAARFVSKFSIATTMSPLDGPLSAYPPSPRLVLFRESQEELRRRSSPVLPVNDSQESATPASIITGVPLADSRTPVPVKQVAELKDSADGYAVGTLEAPSFPVNLSTRSSYAESETLNGEDDGKETMTIMLDQSTDYPIDAVGTPLSSRLYGGTEGRRGSWHRRVGENCPTFSDRNATQSRRVAKPPPLELNRSTRRVKAPPPQMSPLETPQQALDMIQEQLRKFEEPNADDSEFEDQRITLLADIETEMGMQENKWQNMRVDLSRASFSTLPSNGNSPVPSTEVSPVTTRVMQSSATRRNDSLPVREKGSGRPRSSIIYMADQVQISRLNRVPATVADSTVDEASEMVNAPIQEVDPNIGDRNIPPAQVSAPQNAIPNARTKIGVVELQAIKNDKERFQKQDLWNPDKPEHTALTTDSQDFLWNSASESAIDSAGTQSPGPRPVTRRSSEPASIKDATLWGQSQQNEQSQARSPGLWKGALQSPESTTPQKPPARPRTLKPPRRSRRFTSLPDIVENPEPLQNKRGTLGIFQFPWGEKSDTATMPVPLPNQMLMGMPTNMMPGAPPFFPSLAMQMQMLQHQHQQRQQQQPYSFFDYHDDEEAIEDGSEHSDNDSYYDDDDDSFDETTLWEIASLLKSDKVPSRDSLLPGQWDGRPRSFAPQSSVPADVAPPTNSLHNEEQQELEWVTEEKSTTPLLRRESSSPTLGPTGATLWVKNLDIAPANQNSGLLQDDKLWATYVDQKPSTTRVSLKKHEQMSISSTSLWSMQASKMNTGSSTKHLWSAHGQSLDEIKPVSDVQEAIAHSEETATKTDILWSAPEINTVKGIGLPQPENGAWIRYNNLGKGTSRSKSQKGNTLTIESQSLWSPETPQDDTQSRNPDLEESLMPISSSSDEPEEDENEKFPETVVMTMGFVELAVNHTPAISIEDLKNPKSEIVPVTTISLISNDSAPTSDAGSIQSSTPVAKLWVLPNDVTSLGDKEQEGGGVGLFKIQHGIRQLSESSHHKAAQPAAALQTRPTSRSVRRSLPLLESDTLWGAPTEQPFAHDWVTLSSVRPGTPPGPALSDSGSDSSFSETSSTYSNLTGESTVGSVRTGPTPAHVLSHSLAKARSVTNADWEAAIPKTKPAARPRDELLDSVPNWAAPLHTPPQDDSAESIREASTSVPDLDQQRPAAASSETTKEQSGPVPVTNTFRRTQTGGFDPARHHPVFNVYTLDTSVGECHPAAEGYIHTLVNRNPDLIQR